MQHQWVLEVLDDLTDYAARNNLPDLAQGAQALRLRAEAELAATPPPPEDPKPDPGRPSH